MGYFEAEALLKESLTVDIIVQSVLLLGFIKKLPDVANDSVNIA